MKALFLKEFRQGRPLLFFAVALAVLVAIGRSLLAHSDGFYFHNAEELDRSAGVILLCLPAVLALFAGSGLFSGEADRGTVPVLLALPLSRRQIWVGKVLAGLALALVASLLLLSLGTILMPHALSSALFLAYLPDICLWTALAFGAALFGTVLVGNTTSALGFAVIVAGVFVGLAACLVFVFGGPLLGYAETQDMALWGGVFALPLVLASVIALTRGELLDSGRKWSFAGRVLLLGALASLLIVSGVTRLATRYQRSAVMQVGALGNGLEGPVSVLPAVALSSPIQIWRKEGVGWTAFSKEMPPYQNVLSRRNYAVAVDLRTGREMLKVKLPRPRSGWQGPWMACSRDGRYAAVTRPSQGLTWGAREADLVLEIHDLKAGRRIYAGTPSFLKGPAAPQVGFLDWSPSGRCLAASVRPGSGWSKDGSYDSGQLRELKTYLLRTDGRELASLPGRYSEARWSPAEDVLYRTGAGGELRRFSADDVSDQVVWSPPSSSSVEESHLQAVSPDGKWVSLTVSFVRPPNVIPELWVVATDGSEATRLGPTVRPVTAWSADSNTLYAILPDHFRVGPPAGPRPREVYRLVRWQPGMRAPQRTSITLPLDAFGYHLLSRPGSDQMVIWNRFWHPDTATTTSSLLLVDAAGKMRASPVVSLAENLPPFGFTPDGKLILQGESEIITADLDTGETRRVYP